MTAHGNDPAIHRIEVERDEEGEVESVRFICKGTDASPCHHYPDCGCEEWSLELHGSQQQEVPPQPGHENVQQPDCWIDPWFNETTDSPFDFAELYDGDIDHFALDDLRSAAVDVTFEGDYMTWRYASELPSVS